jgi:Mg/Co/Ni transporter MgtE
MTAAELAGRLEQIAGRAQPVSHAPATKPVPPRENGAAPQRTLAAANATDRGSMVLALPADDAAALLAQRSRLFTTAAVEEMCRRPATCAKLLQMLLPDRAAWLLDQVREPGLVAAVVLAMDTYHRGRVLGHMHDRQSAAAVRAMAVTDLRRTGLAVAAMPEVPAGHLLARLPAATIAGLLRHCPPSHHDRLLSQLPSTTREDVERRLA